MPIFEYLCVDCGRVSEVLVVGSEQESQCSHCQSSNLKKLISASSSASGAGVGRLPGLGDTACCGSSPGQAAGCAGPGSCCGGRGH
jgi:putative FmdB family regulatory protein